MLNQSWHKIKTFQGIPAVKDKYSDTVSLCKHLLVPSGKKKKKDPHQLYVIFSSLYMSPNQPFSKLGCRNFWGSELPRALVPQSHLQGKATWRWQPGRNKLKKRWAIGVQFNKTDKVKFYLSSLKGNQNFLIFTPIDFFCTTKKLSRK